MLLGTRSIYVDYVDYDEIAHHAGMLRPESLEALEAVDGVLHQLEQVATAAPRRYHFVILSDHGQAQGTPFADRYGEDLASLVARLAQADVAASNDSVEGWGRTQALVNELASAERGGGPQHAKCLGCDGQARPQRAGRGPAGRGPSAATGRREVGGRQRRGTRRSTSSGPATWA